MNLTSGKRVNGCRLCVYRVFRSNYWMDQASPNVVTFLVFIDSSYFLARGMNDPTLPTDAITFSNDSSSRFTTCYLRISDLVF